MSDDVVVEHVYRVRNIRTGGVTLHNTHEEARGAVREAVYAGELSQLMGGRVDLGSVRMVLAQADRVIVLLAQYRGGEERPQRTGLAVEMSKETGSIALTVMPTRRPVVSEQGEVLKGTADEVAGLGFQKLQDNE